MCLPEFGLLRLLEILCVRAKPEVWVGMLVASPSHGVSSAPTTIPTRERTFAGRGGEWRWGGRKPAQTARAVTTYDARSLIFELGDEANRIPCEEEPGDELWRAVAAVQNCDRKRGDTYTLSCVTSDA